MIFSLYWLSIIYKAEVLPYFAVLNQEKQKSDILKRTSQRGSTFIYVPQKRGTPLIGSNVATALCLHKSQ